MSLDFWLEAERFYDFWVAIIFSLFILNLITVIFVYTYIHKDKRRKPIIALLTFGIVLGLAGMIGHLHYQSYLPEFKHVNPLIRDRTPRFIGYNYYGATEENFYHQLNDIDALRELILYEEIRVTETITYLGEGDHSHYFIRDTGELFRHNRQLVFKDDIEETQLVGARFVLKDEVFHDIGFKNPVNTMFDYLEIPAHMKGTTYQPADETDFRRTENVILNWNFR